MIPDALPPNDTYSIRPATRIQVTRFLDFIWRAVYAESTYPPIIDTPRTAACDEFFVADHHGTITGMASLLGLMPGPKRPRLDVVYVSPWHRRHELARRLTEAALNRFQELGRVPVYCQVISRGMEATIGRVRPDLRELLQVKLDIEDAWDEDGMWYQIEQQALRGPQPPGPQVEDSATCPRTDSTLTPPSPSQNDGK
jgi:GNAT superfamily N-acetyltransferase